MARIAAMKKVLSPISETKMALIEATKPEVKPRPVFGVDAIIVELVVNIVIVSDVGEGDVSQEITSESSASEGRS